MEEIWKDISGYEGYYRVSNFGRVYSVPRLNSLGNRCGGKYLSIRKIGCKKGQKPYYQVCLCMLGVNTNVKLHRLVAEAFIPNPYNKEEVNHIDGDKSNNNVSNLEWVTHKENCLHSHKYLERNVSTGVNHGRNVLSEQDVEQIYNRIKNLKRSQFNAAELSREFGCDGRAILNIYRKEAWKWLTDKLDNSQ